jgi:hypothetical protein
LPDATSKPFVVCAYVDEFASCVSTPESEYADLRDDLRDNVFGTTPFTFRERVPPWNIPPDCDVYVIDVGGQLASTFGAGARGIFSALLKEVRERPSTYFLVWSSMTARYFQEELMVDVGSEEHWDPGHLPPNVILYPGATGDAFGDQDTGPRFARLRALLGLTDPLPEPEFRLPRWEIDPDVCDHSWTRKTVGGPPDEAYSRDVVEVCEYCGKERTEDDE